MTNPEEFEDLIDSIDNIIDDKSTTPQDARKMALALASEVLGEEYAQCLDKSTSHINNIVEEATNAVMEILTLAEKSFDDGDKDRLKFCEAGLHTLRHVLENDLIPRVDKAMGAMQIVMGFVDDKAPDLSVNASPKNWDFNVRS